MTSTKNTNYGRQWARSHLTLTHNELLHCSLCSSSLFEETPRLKSTRFLPFLTVAQKKLLFHINLCWASEILLSNERLCSNLPLHLTQFSYNVLLTKQQQYANLTFPWTVQTSHKQPQHKWKLRGNQLSRNTFHCRPFSNAQFVGLMKMPHRYFWILWMWLRIDKWIKWRWK